jgi:hypothetical protein
MSERKKVHEKKEEGQKNERQNLKMKVLCKNLRTKQQQKIEKPRVCRGHFDN